MSDSWYLKGAIYEIYLKSFKDSNVDGTGDINEIISKVKYLKDLGVEAISITPFYPSPQIDNGYDISDYYNVASEYRTIEDLQNLSSILHENNLKQIIDIVLNHTSDQQ